MEWLNIHISTLRSPEFIGSDPTERATWLCVLGYSVDQENGGRIAGAALWKDRQWQQACGVTAKEVRGADRLLRIDGADILVNGYPTAKERQVQANRSTALAGAMAKWGKGGGKSPQESAATRSQRLSAARQKGTHTNDEWQEMLGHFASCVRCGATECELVKDHIIPIYQGGSDAIQNLQPLCRSCNSSKGPECVDWRVKAPAKCPEKWLPETPAPGSHQAPAEGKGTGREGKGREEPASPAPLNLYIRTKTKDRDSTRENQAAVASLIQRFGLDLVKSVAEAICFRDGGKIWPDNAELLATLIGKTKPPEPPPETLPDDLSTLPDGHPLKRTRKPHATKT